jgi:hypothetical protein
MPTIPETWFEKNFGAVPTSFKPTLGRTDIPATTRIDPAKPYAMPGEDPYGRPASDQPFDVIEGWRLANEAMARNSAPRAASAAAKMTEDRLSVAQKRAQLRRALEANRKNKKVTTDWSAMNQDPKAALGNPRITPAGVKEDLGRNLTDRDKFFTGQFETKTNDVVAQARNRYEAMLDARVIGQTTTRTPIMVVPQYKDAAGEAIWFAQQKRLKQSDIQSWQAFFVNQGKLKPGQFVYGAWDASTQKAMYDLMGEANAMGQKVDNVKAMYEASWQQPGGGPPGTGYGSGAPSGPTSTTQRIFSITSLAKGGEILKAYLQQELGRDPSAAEVAAYMRLLNGKERKNPTVVRTTYSADGTASTSTTTEANVDPGASADDFVSESLKKEKGARDTMEYMSLLDGM